MIGAIVQARMGSSRLPGKVLMNINGRPVIEYVFNQLNHCSDLQKIILATTNSSQDDPLIQWAEENNIQYFRGDESDVLSRYYQIAKKHGISDIVRITADCPLISAEICSQLIQFYKKNSLDICHTGPSFGEGVDCEIFKYHLIEEAFFNANLQSEREHITQYIYKNKQLLNYKKYELDNDHSRFRFTLDEPCDFQVLDAIIQALGNADNLTYFSYESVIDWLESHPEIMKLNAQVERNFGLKKSLENDAKIDHV